MVADSLSSRPREFVIYVPNAKLTAFHNRSPWLMLPRSFVSLGFEVTLICGELATGMPEPFRVVQTGIVVKGPPGSGVVRSIFEPLLAIREVLRTKPDIVLIGPMRSSLIALCPLIYLSRRVLSNPTKFVLKTDWSLDPTGLSRFGLSLSRILLAVSSHVLDLVSIETSCGVERANMLPMVQKRKIVCIPIGCPQNLIERGRSDNSIRNPIILCVARIARMKGQDVLLRAFSMLAEGYPSWSVHLVGPEQDGKFKQELIDYLEEQHLEGRVTFAGQVEERVIDAEYARAAIFCLPSVHSENAGQVKYEATAAGLPVVTTDVPCGRDAIDNGWAVSPAGDPASLAAQLEVLMRDEETRRVRVERAHSVLISYKDVASLYIRELNRRELNVPCNRRYE